MFPQVYVDPLCGDDLLYIAQAMFPKLAPAVWDGTPLLQRMIHFNNEIQRGTETGQFGRSGAPWEFNLRDLFRWCELTERLQGPGDHAVDCWKPQNTVFAAFVVRFRSEADRQAVSELFASVFGVRPVVVPAPQLFLDAQALSVGPAVLPRVVVDAALPAVSASSAPLLHGSIASMQYIALAVEMRSPCLLVGPGACGKTSSLRTLAALTGRVLREITLSSSADSTDILGCFEQVRMCSIVVASFAIQCDDHGHCSIVHPHQVDTSRHVLDIVQSLDDLAVTTSQLLLMQAVAAEVAVGTRDALLEAVASISECVGVLNQKGREPPSSALWSQVGALPHVALLSPR